MIFVVLVISSIVSDVMLLLILFGLGLEVFQYSLFIKQITFNLLDKQVRRFKYRYYLNNLVKIFNQKVTFQPIFNPFSIYFIWTWIFFFEGYLYVYYFIQTCQSFQTIKYLIRDHEKFNAVIIFQQFMHGCHFRIARMHIDPIE